MFCCILKIVLENIFRHFVAFWKCYLSTNFSYFLRFQKNFIIKNFNIYILKETKVKTKPFIKLKKIGQTERGRKREWLKTKRKREVDRERERSVMGNEIETTRSVMGDEIEMTRVQSRGRRQRALGGGRL